MTAPCELQFVLKVIKAVINSQPFDFSFWDFGQAKVWKG